MNVVIIAPDNRVAVDGVWKTVAVDAPHINAVRFDGERATIEHRPHNGEWLPPRELTAEEFTAEFGAVLDAYAVAPDDVPASVTPEQIAADFPDFDPKTATLPQMAAILAKIMGR